MSNKVQEKQLLKALSPSMAAKTPSISRYRLTGKKEAGNPAARVDKAAVDVSSSIAAMSPS